MGLGPCDESYDSRMLVFGWGSLLSFLCDQKASQKY